MQPHGSQSHCADNVGQINHSPEKAFKADAAGDDHRKQKSQGHDDHAADQPDTEKVPHRYAEQAGIGQPDKIGQAGKLPFGHRVGDSVNLEKAHDNGADDGIEENNRKHQYRRS